VQQENALLGVNVAAIFPDISLSAALSYNDPRYDASDFFRQAEPRREERQIVETRGPFRVEHFNSLEGSTNTVRPK
jgi:hypothetical protein